MQTLYVMGKTEVLNLISQEVRKVSTEMLDGACLEEGFWKFEKDGITWSHLCVLAVFITAFQGVSLLLEKA